MLKLLAHPQLIVVKLCCLVKAHSLAALGCVLCRDAGGLWSLSTNIIAVVDLPALVAISVILVFFVITIILFLELVIVDVVNVAVVVLRVCLAINVVLVIAAGTTTDVIASTVDVALLRARRGRNLILDTSRSCSGP